MAANAFAMIQYYNVKISPLVCSPILTFEIGRTDCVIDCSSSITTIVQQGN